MATSKKTLTIRDIAKLADVSYQTVSLVINDKPGVSDKTRRRIQRLMRDLEFHPNKAAQMLSTNRSNTVELIMVAVAYPGRMANSTKTMATRAKERGYSLLISETDHTGLAASLESARARMVDGVVLYAPRLTITDEELGELAGGLPLVRRDYIPGSQIAWVGLDQGYATRLVVEHLISLGHRHIAAIPPSLDMLNGYWRYTSWLNVLREHGLEPGPSYPGDYSMQSGYVAAQFILQTGKPFTALVVGTDNMAVGALRALREHGLRVPDDVSVAGYDNDEVSTFIEPPLTTIDFKFNKQDELAVEYLLDIIANPTMERHQHVLLPELIVRESTRRLS
jgi:LacI family transcriptional regulator